MALVSAAVWLLRPGLEAAVRPILLSRMEASLTAEDRERISRQIVAGAHLWEIVPDADVGGLARPNRTVVLRGAEVEINNAGMRASRAYVTKPDSVFRVVCLGDSLVMGMGGREEDRFCDQLEAFYRDHAVRVDGRTVQALAVGLPGWSLVQSTTYLTHRLTNYDPDVVLVVAMPNDITDNFGVTGTGDLTGLYSRERASQGSAVFFNQMNHYFGETADWSALAWDVSPESRRRWDKAMQRLGRLVELQAGRGKHVLVSAVSWPRADEPTYAAALFLSSLRWAGLPAPFLFTSFMWSRRTSLPHDDHPNRRGNAILRDRYVHALHDLGWVEVPDDALPDLHPLTPATLNPEPDEAHLDALRSLFVEKVPEELDFVVLHPVYTRTFLGGLLPEYMEEGRQLELPPWASIRAGFVLHRPSGRPLEGVEVEVEIPSLAELFPFELVLSLDGAPAATLSLAGPEEAGRHVLRGAPTGRAFAPDLVEVILETESYFNTIEDVRMKSYRILRARAF